jgi:sporulation protein YlmC with PRC-barrel domain
MLSDIISGVPMKISEVYNMDIYSDAGQYLGEVRDAIVDLERGEVSRLLMEEWKNADKEEVKRILQQKSVLFKNIKNIGDVVLVSAVGQGQKHDNAEEVSNLSGR